MPKREDIKNILVVGAGPIVIGQACEFDYSGTQACMALKEAGYQVILVNSNPATIMTDEQLADATYIVPITPETVAEIIAKEKPDALLPTVGGQTALNCSLALVQQGVLERHGVELLSVSPEAIDCAEDRQKFAEAVKELGFLVPNWGLAHNMDEAWQVVETIGYPVIIRPSFTLGGTGGGIAYNVEEFEAICETGFSVSPSLLIDQSIIGWKEYELELICDGMGRGIVVCTIENLDPMGVHTGDSITVAPAQTLLDKEYQCLRDAALKILARVGINSGGANVQFAVNPDNGDWVVIEMNPRVSRSSALASKATGFPIAAVATKLAMGYTLDELQNAITHDMPAAFEPSLDYVVTKIPRFNFEKFPETNASLTTQMKSVGEVMGIGRTFQESLQKALRSLEIGVSGLDSKVVLGEGDSNVQIENALQNTPWDRLWYVADAFRFGMSIEEVHQMCHIDPWFLRQIEDLVETEQKILHTNLEECDKETLWQLKRKGFSDQRLATLWHTTDDAVRERRWALGVHPVYKRVDSCAGEFDTSTNYLYSTYEPYCESRPTSREKIMILGGGPNRIGQGIEFDYCCVHAAMALKESHETIMVNCNPETVSTDYNISDRLYFEPVTLEDVLEIVHIEQPKGVVVQYGGQTPLKLASALQKAGVPIVGTQPEAIQLAEDRERFSKLCDALGLKQPPGGIVRNVEEGLRLAKVLAYPLIVRPSYVLGGRAMEVIYSEVDFIRYLHRSEHISADAPLLLDHFLDGAIEIDADAISDGEQVLVCGIMEHIEQAGVHSGDSACCLPAHSLSQDVQDQVADQMMQLAKAIGVVGLMNAQFAYLNNELFILEVNPRASRTVPFVAKTMGIPLAKVAAKCMLGKSLVEQGVTKMPNIRYKAVKRPVFPFAKFPDVDPILGPEMRSTGEVMGLGATFGEAFYQSELAAGEGLPEVGCAFVSVRDADKAGMVPIAKQLVNKGFSLIATQGTANYLQEAGVLCQAVNKVTQGRPHIVDMIKNGQVDLIINTTQGVQAIADSFTIRRSAVLQQVCYTTTLAGAQALCAALVEQAQFELTPLQQLYQEVGEIL